MATKNYRTNFAVVDADALQMALNVLKRAGKIEVAEELERSAVMGLNRLPVSIGAIYDDWSQAITAVDIGKEPTPVGISFSTTGQMCVNYSLTTPMRCQGIDHAHEIVYKHFVLDKMKV